MRSLQALARGNIMQSESVARGKKVCWKMLRQVVDGKIQGTEQDKDTDPIAIRCLEEYLRLAEIHKIK